MFSMVQYRDRNTFLKTNFNHYCAGHDDLSAEDVGHEVP